MNYYERHIGDYLKDTAHLSLLEHGVYTRLLDVYYTRESGIPEADAARLIGARSKDEREALAAVLREFFVLDAGVHSQARADREVAAYREGDEDRDHKRDNAKERQRRARERRKGLFVTLKEHGIVPDWNTPVHALEAMLSRVTKEGPSPPVTPPVTRDNTATHTHTQSHTHTQVTTSVPSGTAADAAEVAPIDVIFAVGLPMLTAAGIPEKQARSFLGVSRQQSGDEALVAAIDRCAQQQAIDPIAFIRAHLAPTKARVGKQSALEARNAEESRRFLAELGGAPC